jgi:hypothetical protein
VVPYLAIGAAYRDEAPYLREWIEFHRLVGVERFFLYNNLSEDDHREVLAPYIDSGVVVWHDWPLFPGQLQAFDDCIERHRQDARWIAFVDADEFLFSPTLRPVSEILRDFEEFPGVAVNCLTFGNNGHQTPPPGLVIDNYRRRTDRERRARIVKSVVQPERVLHVGSVPHYFRYKQREKAVNERREQVRGHETEAASYDLLRINHYFTRSQVERERKLASAKADNGLPRRPEQARRRDAMLDEVEDETILAYLPQLRRAMGEQVSGPAG